MSPNSHIIEMQFEKNEIEYLKVFIYVSLHLLCSQYSVNLRKNTRGLSYFLKQINLHTKTQVNVNLFFLNFNVNFKRYTGFQDLQIWS